MGLIVSPSSAIGDPRNGLQISGEQFSPLNLPGLLCWFNAGLGITLNEATLTAGSDFTDAAWGKTGCTIGSNVTADPFGGTLADAIIEDTSTGSHGAIQSIGGSLVAACPITYTLFAKANTRSWVNVWNTTGNVYVNLATGATGATSGTVTSVGVTSAGNGWWKIVVTTSTAGGQIQVACANSAPTSVYAGDGVSSIYVYGVSITQPKISSWGDQSGNGRHFTQTATAAAQPLWSATGGPLGKPCVSGDGVDDTMINSGFAPAQPLIGIATCKWDTAFAATSTMYDAQGGNRARFYRSTTNGVVIYAGNALSSSAVPSTTAWGVWVCTFNATNSGTVYLGTSYASGNAGSNAIVNGMRLFAYGGNSDWAAASMQDLQFYAQTPVALEMINRMAALQKSRNGL